jgi:hypothetical protein
MGSSQEQTLDHISEPLGHPYSRWLWTGVQPGVDRSGPKLLPRFAELAMTRRSVEVQSAPTKTQPTRATPSTRSQKMCGSLFDADHSSCFGTACDPVLQARSRSVTCDEFKAGPHGLGLRGWHQVVSIGVSSPPLFPLRPWRPPIVKQVLIRLVLLLLVVAVLGAGGYYVYQRSGEAGGLRAWIASLTKQQSAAPATPGQQAGPPPEVGVFTVQPAEIPLPVEYAARVAGFRDVEIRARVSGLLLSREFEEGARVNENQVLFRIDPATYEVALSRSARRVDPQTGTIQARAIFPNPDGALLPGQFVRVVIRGVTLPEAIVIPNQAIVQGPQGPSVYVVGENGNAQVRTIRVGQQVEGGGVVQNGLQAGDRVVVEGIIRVRPGAPVKPVPVTPAPQTAQAAAPEAPAALQTGSTTSTSAEPAQAPAAEPARAQQQARKPASRQAGARP